MDTLLQTIGATVVALVCADVFLTVLFPASGRGPLRKPLEQTVWRLFRTMASLLGPRRRSDLLSYAGPVLLAVTFWAWFAALVAGWAMIYKPALGSQITVTSGPTDTGWASAIYYSGFNLTTLGVGDFTPHSPGYRLLTVGQGALGFGFFSLVVTYFLSIYPSLTSRNAFAQGLHHLTGKTGDAVEFLARFADDADLPLLRQHMMSKAEFLRQVYQTHRFYPILRYFHYREIQYELPRILLIALDSATLLRTAPARDSRHSALQPRILDDLLEAAMSLLRELTSGDGQGERSDEADGRWRGHYAHALSRLSQAGIPVRDDVEAGARDYADLRSQWDGMTHELAARMMHEWTAVEPSAESIEKQRVKC